MSALALKKEFVSTPRQPITRSSRPDDNELAYLAKERLAEVKSEYFDGQMVAMAGASRVHNRIVTNLVARLDRQLENRVCNVYSSDMRVRIPETRSYTYPDVVVTCGKEFFADEAFDVLLNPVAIIEACPESSKDLSDSTERYDRVEKFQHYQRIPSLKLYVLVEQKSMRVEMYVKQTDKLWLYSVADEREAVVGLEAIGCQLSLEEIYAKVPSVEKG